ncbi:MAG: DUF2270 domain-containing protein [Anaerolineae bacterium]|nr:DUF2270 domain-containing protein [Anaerolineae bacterium]
MQGAGGRKQEDRPEGLSWTFRGQRLDMSQFITAMAHFYRAEISRCNTWRTRLDTTTNWAVVTVGAGLTFVFGAPQNPHFVLLLVLSLVLIFLYIEARRYQYYALWSYRARFIETDFFAAMLASPRSVSSDWADHLAQSLVQPSFPIGRLEALGRRFQRNYVWLTTLLLLSWILKLAMHPTAAPDVSTLVERAGFWLFPGSWVMACVGLAYFTLVALSVIVMLRIAWLAEEFPAHWLGKRLRRVLGPLMPSPQARERLATIITACGREIALQILTELGRGVTALKGIGMYTNEARDVLLCAVTDVQVPHLERIAYCIDPKAFVIVSTAEEVRGWGFRPFETPS